MKTLLLDFKQVFSQTSDSFPALWWRLLVLLACTWLGMFITLIAVMTIPVMKYLSMPLPEALEGLPFVAIGEKILNGDISIFEVIPVSFVIGVLVVIILVSIFGLILNIASYLSLKNYESNKPNNPLRVYFQDSWKYFWNFAWLQVRMFWYLVWPLLVLLLVVGAISLSISSVFAAPLLEVTNTIDTEIEAALREIPSVYDSTVLTEGTSGEVDSLLKQRLSTGTALFLLLGALGLLIWRGINLSLVLPYYFQHQLSVSETMDNAINVVKKQWWKVFGLLCLFFIPLILLSVIVQILEPVIGSLFTEILDLILQVIIFPPLSVAFPYFVTIMLDQKQKKSHQKG